MSRDPEKVKDNNCRYYQRHSEKLKERTKKNYQKDPEKYREYAKEYYQKNSEKLKKSSHERYQKSLEKHKGYKLSKIGWTSERFKQALAGQKTLCAVCSLPMSKPCADHKHTKPPKPRGILCNNCNVLIGFSKESPKICRAAADYLEKWEDILNES